MRKCERRTEEHLFTIEQSNSYEGIVQQNLQQLQAFTSDHTHSFQAHKAEMHATAAAGKGARTEEPASVSTPAEDQPLVPLKPYVVSCTSLRSCQVVEKSTLAAAGMASSCLCVSVCA